MNNRDLSKQKIDIIEDYTDANSFEPFPCTACGQCCRNVYLSALTEYLSRGDGVCRFLDENSNLCSIYEERPLVCNVSKYFEMYLKDKISWDDYLKQNLSVCQILQVTH